MAVKKIANFGAEELPEEYICESTDVKPTEDVVVGSTLWELDSKKGYIFDGTNWREV